jgi:hypothetical protein
MADCIIEVNGKEFEVELRDTPTARIIYDHLPLNGSVQRWGDEIFFDVALPAIRVESTAQQKLRVGDLAYWIEGSSICLVFGTVPLSTGDEPIAAKPINVFGKVLGDLALLRDIQEGELINISK